MQIPGSSANVSSGFYKMQHVMDTNVGSVDVSEEFILRTADRRGYTYLLISSECTLYLLSSLYLPALACGSIGTLFLYLVVGGRKHDRRQTRGNRKNLKRMKQNN